MLVATVVLLVGALASVVGTQIRGLRLGGVLVVPMLCVYTLYDFTLGALLVAAGAVSWLSVALLKRRTLAYGRQLFVVAILAGAFAPILVATAASLLGGDLSLTAFDLFGSVLPGIAAYNLHRIDTDLFVEEVVSTAVLTVGLLAVALITLYVVARTGFGRAFPALLLSREASAAAFLGLPTVDTDYRSVLPPVATLVVTLGGLGVSELARKRWGLRVGGLVVMPLIALFALRNPWSLGVFAVAALYTFAVVRAINFYTLVYGRVLLAMGVVTGTLVALFFAVFVPFSHGLEGLFVGVFAGIAAYNWEVVPPVERPFAVGLSAGVLAVLYWLGVFAGLVAGLPLNPATVPWLAPPSVLATAAAVYVVWRFEWRGTESGRRDSVAGVAVRKRRAANERGQGGTDRPPVYLRGGRR